MRVSPVKTSAPEDQSYSSWAPLLTCIFNRDLGHCAPALCACHVLAAHFCWPGIKGVISLLKLLRLLQMPAYK